MLFMFATKATKTEIKTLTARIASLEIARAEMAAAQQPTADISEDIAAWKAELARRAA